MNPLPVTRASTVAERENLLLGWFTLLPFTALVVPLWHLRVASLELWLGFVAGLGLALLLHRHRRRAFVPFGWLGLTVLLLFNLLDLTGGLWLGLCGGLILAATLTVLHDASPPHRRWRNAALSVLLVMLVGGAAWVGLPLWLQQTLALGLWPLLLWWYRRAIVELAAEVVMLPLYRMRGHGPELRRFPAYGPVVVVCNHSAWFDPLWLGKYIPRAIRPMMTSRFYDRPLVRPLMRYVIAAIRVESTGFRRDVPELAEALAVLDRGEVLVIFPEGALKRTADQPLRRFGKGVWELLQQRPEVPVVPCWIEGGFGSYTSYAGGPPTKNKLIDVRRPIDVVIGSPEWLDETLQADHLAARRHLMDACSALRSVLGLDVPARDHPLAEPEEE